jgi:hypothetical protein
MITTSISVSAQPALAERFSLCQYDVSFNPLPIDDNKSILTPILNNPDKCHANLFTPEQNLRASITIKRFDEPQAASNSAMWEEVRDILKGYNVIVNTININDEEIDEYYCKIGYGFTPFTIQNVQQTWFVAYCWLDRRQLDNSEKWQGQNSCCIISDYPQDITMGLLRAIHVRPIQL